MIGVSWTFWKFLEVSNALYHDRKYPIICLTQLQRMFECQPDPNHDPLYKSDRFHFF